MIMLTFQISHQILSQIHFLMPSHKYSVVNVVRYILGGERQSEEVRAAGSFRYETRVSSVLIAYLFLPLYCFFQFIL